MILKVLCVLGTEMLKTCNKKGKCREPLGLSPQETPFNDRTESIVRTLFFIVLPLLDYFVSFIGVGTAVTLRQGLIM